MAVNESFCNFRNVAVNFISTTNINRARV
jgi:hypothetical protein